MKNILSIGHNELRLFLKSRAGYIWLFVVPLLFIWLFARSPTGSGTATRRLPPILIENADTGFLGAFFIEELSAQGLWRVDPAQDKKNKPVREIRIPSDFTERVLAQRASNVELRALPAGDGAQGDAALVEVRLLRALVAMNSHLIEATVTAGAPWPPTEATLRAARDKPALVALDSKYANPRAIPTGIAFSLPGNLVSFLMMNLLIFGGATVASTRRSGVLKRLLTLPVRRGELVAGQIYGIWLLGGVQITFFLLMGRFAFGLNLGTNLPGVLMVLLVFAWVAAAIGVLVGSLLDAPDRVAGVCVLASMIMAAIGGCWVPAEIMPEWMRLAAHCIPTGWALDGLHQLISFGGDLGSVVKPLAVLGGFGLAATAAASRWFRV
jgi:ABC-2 type transport system permease protein